MKVASYRRVTRSDLGKVPSWVDTLLEPIQRQLEILTIAMQNNLTPFQNFAAETKEIALPHSLERQFSLVKLKSKPWGIIPVWADDNRSMEGFSWRSIDTNTVAVTAWFGNPAPAGGTTPEIKVKLWVFGGGE